MTADPRSTPPERPTRLLIAIGAPSESEAGAALGLLISPSGCTCR
ncbi:MAG: hypothetical protein U0531_11170 [Dehalococcoidia bacterium]